MYTLNCKALYFNHQCGNKSKDAVTHGGVKLRCGDFPYDSVYRVGFIQGFFIIERKNDNKQLDMLGGGEFMDLAKEIGPLISERIVKSANNQLFERYFTKIRQTEGLMLQVGLGCAILHGPDLSAILWRRYFPKRQIEFMEIDIR